MTHIHSDAFLRRYLYLRLDIIFNHKTIHIFHPWKVFFHTRVDTENLWPTSAKIWINNWASDFFKIPSWSGNKLYIPSSILKLILLIKVKIYTDLCRAFPQKPSLARFLVFNVRPRRQSVLFRTLNVRNRLHFLPKLFCFSFRFYIFLSKVTRTNDNVN